MSNQNSILQETADRLAIRNLVDAWAHCADRRLAEQQAALFIDDGRVAVYSGNAEKASPLQVLQGRTELANGFANGLKSYDTTTHFNGQSTVTITDDHATGESYCLAHHLFIEDGQRVLLIMSIRYLDIFARVGGKWLFAERKLIIDWTDRRFSSES